MNNINIISKAEILSQTEGFVFFWHSPSPFSQWHPAIFTVNGVLFTSAEQFMMYCKAKLFGDEEVAKALLLLNDEQGSVLRRFIDGELSSFMIVSNYATKNQWDFNQKKIKQLGRQVKGYNEKDWVAKRVVYVTRGNKEKFTQNPELKAYLLATGNTRLVEANPYDKIWSCGLKETDPCAKTPVKWPGLDLLGEILTVLRHNIR